VELETRRELLELDSELTSAREELISVTRDNTRLLNDTSDLAHDKRLLETQLNEALKAPDDRTAVRRQEEAEHKQLVQLARMQASEIEAVRQEISRLMRKGGHVLPPQVKPGDKLPPVRSR
jgi:hypothetical protein